MNTFSGRLQKPRRKVSPRLGIESTFASCRATRCSGRRATCEIQKRSRHGCLYKFISARPTGRVFGSADHSGANRTLDRAGAAREL